MKVVLASNNKGKIRELHALLSQFNIEIIAQADLGVDEIEETGLTFIENALQKARHASRVTGLPALADDSGIAVPALQGAPGIYSARYAGKKAEPSDNINKLLTDMKHLPDGQRQASFHCVLAYLTHANDPTPIVCDGIWNGIVLQQPSAVGGFGYDPVFYVPSEKKAASELPLDLKNKLSHRGKALHLLMEKLADNT